MNTIKEINLIDVRKNSQIINTLNKVYRLWGYEKVSPSIINNVEILKGREIIKQNELVSLVSNKSLCLRPEMTTSIVKLISTRFINKKRPVRLWNNGTIFERIDDAKNSQILNERLQSGVELIGYNSNFPEIEVISILFDAINRLKIKDNCNLIFLVSSTTIMELILKKYIDNNYEQIKECMINLDQDDLNNLDIDIEDKKNLKDLLYTRGAPNEVLNKLTEIYGDSKVLDDLRYLFNIISPIASKHKIQIQLDPTFQPHLNIYEGMVFQLICDDKNEKSIIAKGGRYDELVRHFNPSEKFPTGLGFSISIDNLRKYIKEEDTLNKKILLVFRDKKLLAKAIKKQSKLHDSGIVSILEINPVEEIVNVENMMNENGCTEIMWVN